MKIAEFDGGMPRNGGKPALGEIWIEEGIECSCCGKRGTCVCIDGSEGEYNEGRICRLCLVKSFWRFISRPIDEVFYVREREC